MLRGLSSVAESQAGGITAEDWGGGDDGDDDGSDDGGAQSPLPDSAPHMAPQSRTRELRQSRTFSCPIVT